VGIVARHRDSEVICYGPKRVNFRFELTVARIYTLFGEMIGLPHQGMPHVPILLLVVVIIIAVVVLLFCFVLFCFV
jgi:hypothetical protein